MDFKDEVKDIIENRPTKEDKAKRRAEIKARKAAAAEGDASAARREADAARAEANRARMDAEFPRVDPGSGKWIFGW